MNNNKIKISAFFLLLALLLTVSYGVQQDRQYSLGVDQVMILKSIDNSSALFPVQGILNSNSTYNPPMHSWLYLITNQIFYFDLSLVMLIPALLLHWLASLSLFSLGYRYISPMFGYLCGISYVVAGRADYYATATWAQAILPALYSIFLYFAIKWILENKNYGFILAILVGAYAFGLHLSGILIIATFIFLCVIFRELPPLLSFVKAGLLSILLFVPFLIFELDRNWEDIVTLFNQEGGSGSSRLLPPTSFIAWGMEFYMRFVKFFLFNLEKGLLSYNGILPLIEYYFLAFLFCIGFIFCLYQCLKNNREKDLFFEKVVIVFLAVLLFLHNLTPYNPAVRLDLVMPYFPFVIIFCAYGIWRSSLLLENRNWKIVTVSLFIFIPVLSYLSAFPTKWRTDDWKKEFVKPIFQLAKKNNLQSLNIGYCDNIKDKFNRIFSKQRRVDENYYPGLSYDFYLDRVFGIKNENDPNRQYDVIVLYQKSYGKEFDAYEKLYSMGDYDDSLLILSDKRLLY